MLGDDVGGGLKALCALDHLTVFEDQHDGTGSRTGVATAVADRLGSHGFTISVSPSATKWRMTTSMSLALAISLANSRR